VRESSQSKTRSVAERKLQKALRAIDQGIAPPLRFERTTYEELRDGLLSEYQITGKKWLRTGKDGRKYICGISQLDKFFAQYRAICITTDSITEFILARQAVGASNGTVNRSLALLRRMFNLAIRAKKFREIPYFPMLKEAAPRSGFLEHQSFVRLRSELPEYLRPILTAGYFTGMRLGEILKLQWRNVDLVHGTINLDQGTTKNGEARNVPLIGELRDMLKIERERNSDAEFLFVLDGERIKSFRKAWNSASVRAGLGRYGYICRVCKTEIGEEQPRPRKVCPSCLGRIKRVYRGLIFHDLRRTGVRNLVRAGVPERVAMAISGHKTRSTFERYNITSLRDLQIAATKLEKYLQTQNGASSGQPEKTDVGELDRHVM